MRNRPWEGAMAKRRSFGEELGEPVAGNGLLDRRFFLQSGAALAGAAAAVGPARAESIGAVSPPTMSKPGSGFTAYGMPSHWRDNIKRILVANAPPGREVTGSSRTPLQLLEGAITPAGLHYVRIHKRVPDIDPNQHTLVIYRLVKQPVTLHLDSVMRYPMQLAIRFIECAR